MADYTPSEQYTAALDDYERTKAAHDRAKEALRLATADELRASGLSGKAFKPLSPWSEETLRGIVHEYEIPLKRSPTVKSIKPRKRAVNKPAS